MNVTLPNGLSFKLPHIRFGVMGIHHHGKSRLCASMTVAGKLLVLACDPVSKLQTYLDYGIPDDEERTGQFNQPVYLVRSPRDGYPYKNAKAGDVIIQIECYLDDNPNNPWAFQALWQRLEQVKAEVLAGWWANVVLDSWSQLEYIAKLRRTIGAYRADAPAAALKDDCESIIKSYLSQYRCNVGVTLHLNSKLIDAGGGTMLYEPIATGTLKAMIGSVLGEMWRAVATPDAAVSGGVRFTLQTKPDGRFDCGTNIDAPNGCPNEFTAVYANWIAKRAAMGAAPASTTAEASADAPQKEQ